MSLVRPSTAPASERRTGRVGNGNKPPQPQPQQQHLGEYIQLRSTTPNVSGGATPPLRPVSAAMHNNNNNNRHLGTPPPTTTANTSSSSSPGALAMQSPYIAPLTTVHDVSAVAKGGARTKGTASHAHTKNSIGEIKKTNGDEQRRPPSAAGGRPPLALSPSSSALGHPLSLSPAASAATPPPASGSGRVTTAAPFTLMPSPSSSSAVGRQRSNSYHSHQQFAADRSGGARSASPSPSLAAVHRVGSFISAASFNAAAAMGGGGAASCPFSSGTTAASAAAAAGQGVEEWGASAHRRRSTTLSAAMGALHSYEAGVPIAPRGSAMDAPPPMGPINGVGRGRKKQRRERSGSVSRHLKGSTSTFSSSAVAAAANGLSTAHDTSADSGGGDDGGGGMMTTFLTETVLTPPQPAIAKTRTSTEGDKPSNSSSFPKQQPLFVAPAGAGGVGTATKTPPPQQLQKVQKEQRHSGVTKEVTPKVHENKGVTVAVAQEKVAPAARRVSSSPSPALVRGPPPPSAHIPPQQPQPVYCRSQSQKAPAAPTEVKQRADERKEKEEEEKVPAHFAMSSTDFLRELRRRRREAARTGPHLSPSEERAAAEAQRGHRPTSAAHCGVAETAFGVDGPSAGYYHAIAMARPSSAFRPSTLSVTNASALAATATATTTPAATPATTAGSAALTVLPQHSHHHSNSNRQHSANNAAAAVTGGRPFTAPTRTAVPHSSASRVGGGGGGAHHDRFAHHSTGDAFGEEGPTRSNGGAFPRLRADESDDDNDDDGGAAAKEALRRIRSGAGRHRRSSASSSSDTNGDDNNSDGSDYHQHRNGHENEAYGDDENELLLLSANNAHRWLATAAVHHPDGSHSVGQRVSEVFFAAQRIRHDIQEARRAAFDVKEARREDIRTNFICSNERKRIADMKLRGQMLFPMLLSVLFAMKCGDGLRDHHQLDVHRRLLEPILSRKIRVARLRAEEAAFTAARLPNNPRPSVEMLRATGGNPKDNFFALWSDEGVAFFISLLKPRSFRRGAWVMHAGDLDRVMYIVTNGTVIVQVKKRTPQDKRRNSSGAQLIPLKAPTYVGEFALLCREPRGATIVCGADADVDTWLIDRADFEKVLNTLSFHSVSALDEVANSRRKSNMERFFPLHEDAVRAVPGLSHLCLAHVRSLISRMAPHILITNTVYVSENEYRPDILFAADGVMELTKPSDPSFTPIRYGKGFSYGLREALFHQEASPFTVTAVGGVAEIWLLSREALFDASAFFPSALAGAVAALKADCAGRMLKAAKVPQFVVNDPYLRHTLAPPTMQSLLWQRCAEPVIFSRGEVLQQEGAAPRYMYIIARGSVTIQHGANMAGGEAAERNDALTACPDAARGVFSARGAHCSNLWRYHPAVIRARPLPPITSSSSPSPSSTKGIGPPHQRGGAFGATPAPAPAGGGAASTFATGPRKRAVCRLTPACPPESLLSVPQAAEESVGTGDAATTAAKGRRHRGGGANLDKSGSAAVLSSSLVLGSSVRRGGGGGLLGSSMNKKGGAGGSDGLVGELSLADRLSNAVSEDADAVQRRAEVGFIVGAYEFAAQRQQCASTVVCASYVEAWRVDGAALQQELQRLDEGRARASGGSSSAASSNATGTKSDKNKKSGYADGDGKPVAAGVTMSAQASAAAAALLAHWHHSAVGSQPCAELIAAAWTNGKIIEVLMRRDVPSNFVLSERRPTASALASLRKAIAAYVSSIPTAVAPPPPPPTQQTPTQSSAAVAVAAAAAANNNGNGSNSNSSAHVGVAVAEADLGAPFIRQLRLALTGGGGRRRRGGEDAATSPRSPR